MILTMPDEGNINRRSVGDNHFTIEEYGGSQNVTTPGQIT